jgi:phage-related tail fiber protein
MFVMKMVVCWVLMAEVGGWWVSVDVFNTLCTSPHCPKHFKSTVKEGAERSTVRNMCNGTS